MIVFSQVCAAVVMIAGCGSLDQQTIMEFDGVVPPSGSRIPGAYYFERGFNITTVGAKPSANGIYGPEYPGINTNHTSVFAWCNSAERGCRPEIRLSHWGAYFDLLAIDVSNFASLEQAGPIPNGLAVVATGHKKGGEIVTQTLPIVQDVWQTYWLNDFTGLTWVSFMTNMQGERAEGDVAIDYINMRYTPEPATLALALGGVAAWLWRRRKRG